MPGAGAGSDAAGAALGGRSRWQVSTAGGSRPRWRRDGRELFYLRTDNTLMAVALNGSGESFGVGAEQPLFQAFQRLGSWTYDVTADGQRFVVNETGGGQERPIAVVTNWTRAIGK